MMTHAGLRLIGESDVHRESLGYWLLFPKACLSILLVRQHYVSLPQICQMKATRLGSRNVDKAGEELNSSTSQLYPDPLRRGTATSNSPRVRCAARRARLQGLVHDYRTQALPGSLLSGNRLSVCFWSRQGRHQPRQPGPERYLWQRQEHKSKGPVR